MCQFRIDLLSDCLRAGLSRTQSVIVPLCHSAAGFVAALLIGEFRNDLARDGTDWPCLSGAAHQGIASFWTAYRI